MRPKPVRSGHLDRTRPLNPPPPAQHPGDDPVLARRERIRGLTAAGRRLGYLLFAVAMVLFFLGLAQGYTDLLVTLVVGCLLVGSAVLAPAIVLGYAVKAADRDDAGLDSGH
jgi:hypothetical protein